MSRFFTVVICLLLVPLACSRPWNTAHTGLEVAAEGLVASDEIVARAMAPDHADARAAVVAEYQEALTEYSACLSGEREPPDGTPIVAGCGSEPTVEGYLERYDERVEQWEQVTQALEVLREVLLIAEAAVTAWRDSQEQPDDWSHICQRIYDAEQAVVRAIEATGTDVPEQWERMLTLIRPVCSWTVSQVTSGGES